MDIAAREPLPCLAGMTALECAAGICRIVELQMADIIRKTTVEKGFDPRDFVLFAFGAAGPAHAGVFARELGIGRVVVPQKEAASTWCAFGAAVADVLHILEHAEILATPFDAARIDAIVAALRREAHERMHAEGIEAERHRFEVAIDMRHHGQISEVEVALDAGPVAAECEIDLRRRFVARYEQLYGRGSALAGARLEIVTIRLRARALTPRPQFLPIPPAAARRRTRAIWWSEARALVATAVYDGDKLLAGNALTGPAIMETCTTTVVVQPGVRFHVDEFGNFVLTFESTS